MMRPHYNENPILLCTERDMVSRENHREYGNTEIWQNKEVFIVKAGNGYCIYVTGSASGVGKVMSVVLGRNGGKNRETEEIQAKCSLF